MKMRKENIETKEFSSLLKIGDPMEVVLCCEKRKDLLKIAAQESRNDFVLHIDATGSVVRPEKSLFR